MKMCNTNKGKGTTQTGVVKGSKSSMKGGSYGGKKK